MKINDVPFDQGSPRYHRDKPATGAPFSGVYPMSLGTILVIVLVLFLIGVLPTWPHSTNWGYYPSGGLGTVLIIVVVLLLLGRL
jgi:hypothetical protein